MPPSPTAVAVAPPPALGAPPPPVSSAPASAPVSGPAGVSTTVADSAADADFVGSHPVIYSEEGMASWYGPPYDKRRGANGEIFDKNALTAAHRTLPMNSLIKVTNLSTGQSAILRVTDRGPFVPDRMLDLSLASPKRSECGGPVSPACGWRYLLPRRRSTTGAAGACKLAPSRMRRERFNCATC